MSAVDAIHSSREGVGRLRVCRWCEVFPASSSRYPTNKNAVVPAIQSVFELHVFLYVEENERTEFFPLASSGGVAAESARILDSRVDLLANLLAFIVFPVLPARETALRKQFKKWLQR